MSTTHKRKRIGLISRVRAALRSFALGGTQSEYQGPFTGAGTNRLLLDWMAPSLTADDAVRGSLTRLRARGRDLERNNPYARQYLNLLAVNVIGPHGFGHQAKVANNSGALNETINEKIEEAWEDWSETATRDSRMSLTTLSHLLIKNVARDGETLVRIWDDASVPYGIRLEPIGPELLDDSMWQRATEGGNEIRMGIELDPKGQRVAYHLWNNLTEPVMDRTRTRVPAAEIIHLYSPDSAQQTRGTTWFAPVMVALHMLEGYEQAELVAARVGAAKMGFFQSKASDASEYDDSEQPMTMDAAPATLEKIAKGWEFKEWNPDHPTTAYVSFVKGQLRRVASGLGVSYNALSNDLEGVNYSSMRSGLLIERDLWRTLQQWWTSAFLGPVYQRFIDAAMLSGDLRLDSRDPRKFYSVRWSSRGWAWVDPLKDTQAAVLAIQNGLGSRTDYLAEQGLDYEDVLEDLSDEKALAEEHDVKIDTVPAPPDPSAIDGTDAELEDDAAKDGKGRVITYGRIGGFV